MAVRSRAKASVAAPAREPAPATPASGIMPIPAAGVTEGGTGRYLILLEPGDLKGASHALDNSAGIKLSSIGGSDAGIMGEQSLQEGEGIIFPDLGVAVVNAASDRITSVSAAVAGSPSLHLMEPERYVYAIGGFDLSYFRGYKDAVDHLYEQMAGSQSGSSGVSAAAFDETQLSWGLQVTNVANSRFTGRGIKLAVLDTGLDLQHPDFTGRSIVTQSFVDGQSVQDGNGHGTHCCGVACGPRRPQRLPRFAVAYEADLYVGKVLNDAGRGADANILAGIQWALANGCSVISMSLGGPVQPGQSYSAVFQQIADRALARGCVIVAAAGNDSDRTRNIVAPVSHPANCPGIFAVAAVDRSLTTAYFSNAGLDPGGGKIDVAGPGVDVVSDWPAPTLYKSEDGTSMATPHVAGIAALFAQAQATARGRDLWAHITQHARALPSDSRDVGAGLVQAP